MSGAEIIFFVFAALAVLSALGTITRRNPVAAAVCLVMSFFSVAVCYILLSATFLAAIQVLVYAGAMMVLFVFVIMVLDVDERGFAEHRRPSRVAKVGYYGGLLIAVGFLAWVLVGTLARQFITPGPEDLPPEFGTADGIGREIFRDYLFAFEAISLLLLAAVIGAVVVARSRREREKQARDAGMSRAEMHDTGLEPQSEPLDAPDRGLGPSPYTDFGAPSATGHDGGT